MNSRTARTIKFNRQNILDAANQLFLKCGVEKTTMDQIAAEAGYSKPTLYGYFKDKNEVFFALVLDFMTKMSGQINLQVSKSDRFEDKFLTVCETVFQSASQNPVYFEGLIGQINVDIHLNETPIIYKEIYEAGEAVNQSLEELIDEGKELGFFHDGHNTKALLYFFWSCISGVIRMSLQKTEYLALLNLEQKQICKFCFERLLYGCKTKALEEGSK